MNDSKDQDHESATLVLHEIALKYPISIKPRIAHSSEAASVIVDAIGHAAQERFCVIALDAQNQILNVVVISQGTTTSTLVRPAEVFCPAIMEMATAIVVGHNHPSGNTKPSPADQSVTKRLQAAGEILGIQLLDSLVVTASGHWQSIIQPRSSGKV